MNQIEKDNIIDLLCTSTQENIELAITLCEGYNVNIEDIIEEYGYNSVNIKTPSDFQNQSITYNSYYEIKQFPASIDSITIYAYNGQKLNLHSNVNYLYFEYSNITSFPDLSHVESIRITNSIIDLKEVIENNVEMLHISECKINNINNVIKSFANVIDFAATHCGLKVLPDLSAFNRIAHLSFNLNKITVVDKDYQIPDTLQTLSLAFNKLKSFELDVKNLMTLVLRCNQIVEFNVDLDNSNLTFLDVECNYIVNVEEIKSTKEIVIKKGNWRDTEVKSVSFNDFIVS